MRERLVCATTMLLVLLAFGVGSAAAETTIHIGHKWAETHNWQRSLRAAADAFEAQYPEYKVEIMAGMVDDKLKMSIVAGDAPDAQILTDIVTWAANGFIQPLDGFLAKNHMSVEDYVPAALDRSTWRSELYAMPMSIDPNYGFYWNKVLFAESGLDPDAPPKTVQEYDFYIKRLTKYDSDGTPVRLGMTPWTLLGGNANTVFTWGWLFGAQFYDYAGAKATAHHTGNIKALEYLADCYERYSTAYTALGRGIPTGFSRFTSGREAMNLLNPSTGLNLLAANPDLKLGMARMFNNPAEGVQNATWIGGWDIALTTGARNPEAAFKFIQFMESDPAGVKAFAETGNFMPANVRTQYFRNLGRDPRWQVYTEGILNARNYKPAIPVFGTYNSRLGAMLPRVLRREITPAAALEEISKQVDVEMLECYGK